MQPFAESLIRRNAIVEVTWKLEYSVVTYLYLLIARGRKWVFINMETGRLYLDRDLKLVRDIADNYRVRWDEVQNYFDASSNNRPDLIRFAGYLDDYVFILEDNLDFDFS